MAKFLDYDGLVHYTSCFKPGLAELVDSGAKNLFQIASNTYQNELNGLTATFNADGSVTVTGTMTDTTKDAVVYLSPSRTMDYRAFQGCVLSGGLSETERIVLQNSASPYNTIVASQGTGVEITNTIPEKTQLYIYIIKRSTSVNYTFYPMICTKATWNISQKYVPYRPTYEETVKQVTENENNILLVEQMNGAKNLAPYNSDEYIGNAGYWFIHSNCIDILAGTSVYIVFNYTQTAGQFSVQLTDSNGDAISGTYVYSTAGTTSGHKEAKITIPAGKTAKGYNSYLNTNATVSISNFMIVPAEIYEAGFTDYQPYAMSNAQLTAKEQANENNILSIQTDLAKAVTKGDRYAANEARIYTLNPANTYLITIISYNVCGVFIAYKYPAESFPRLFSIYKSADFDNLLSVSAVASSSNISITPTSSSTWFISNIATL